MDVFFDVVLLGEEREEVVVQPPSQDAYVVCVLVYCFVEWTLLVYGGSSSIAPVMLKTNFFRRKRVF